MVAAYHVLALGCTAGRDVGLLAPHRRKFHLRQCLLLCGRWTVRFLVQADLQAGQAAADYILSSAPDLV